MTSSNPKPIWYPFLNNIKEKEKSLLFNDDQKNKFIVAKDSHKNKKGKIIKKYASFKDYNEFIESVDYFDEEKNDKHFYEVIIERNFEDGFKIYFDIDSKEKITTKKFILYLEEVIIKYTEQSDFDILVYTSSNKEKYSFHIVVDKLKIKDMSSLKAFCNYVKDNCDLKDYIDMSVYKNTQQFRLLYSRKLDTPIERTKRLLKEDKKNIKDFEKSLITNVKNCVEIILDSKDFIIKKKKSPSKEIIIDFDDIPEKDFIEKYLEENNFCEVVDVKEIETDLDKNNNIYLIILKRIDENYCNKCDRIHEGDNPFIMIFKDVIRFFCRRDDSNKGYIIKHREINIIDEKETLNLQKNNSNKKNIRIKNETIL